MKTLFKQILSPHTVVLTPNRRLAAFLLKQFNAFQVEQGHRCWETPTILPIGAWFKQLWLESQSWNTSNQKILLTPLQQQWVWERIIKDHAAGTALLRVVPTAKQAIQAWQLLHEWCLTLETVQPHIQGSLDYQAFFAWAQHYQQWLTEHQALDTVTLLQQLQADLIANTRNALPKVIYLVGVEDPTPLQQAVLAQLEQCSVSITATEITQKNNQLKCLQYPTPEQEIYAVIAAAKAYSQQHPQASLGIVIPDLERKRKIVEHGLLQYWDRSKVNVSAPLPMLQEEMIQVALLVLRATLPTIEITQLSHLLRSGFIQGGKMYAGQRASWDVSLRAKREPLIAWKALSADPEAETVALQHIFEKWQQAMALTQGLQTTTGWAHTMNQLLGIWGWPVIEASDVTSQHLLSCWHEVLNTYCGLETFLGEHHYTTALATVLRLLQETPFAPAETETVSLHILGVLEAAGLVFDHLWVTGFSREQWPPDAAPNPFIPIALQQIHRMPRSSAQRELKVAQRLTETLKGGATQAVIFSYPMMVEEQQTLVSGLIADIPQSHQSVSVPAMFDMTAGVNRLESLRDDKAPPQLSDATSGGTQLLQFQAQCPFKALGCFRLKAKALIQPLKFLTAAERGELVHQVLADFWQKVKSSAKARAYSGEQWVKILTPLIQRCLQKWQRRRPYTLSQRYQLLEQQRLQKICLQWLHYELQSRAPFEVVSVEKQQTIQVGKLKLRIRLDRLDKLLDETTQAEDSYAVIDYKTGQVQVSDLLSESLIQPQLPLYATYAQSAVVVLAFAIVRANQTEFKGIADTAERLPKIGDIEKLHNINWSDQLRIWQDKLELQAESFAQGEAQVAPLQGEATCRYCELQALCRIHETVGESA